MITNFKVLQEVRIYSSSFFSFFYFWDNDTITPFLSFFSLYKLPFTLPFKFMVSFQLLLCAYTYVCGVYVYTHIFPNIACLIWTMSLSAHPQGWALGIRQSVAVLIPGEDYFSYVDISKCYCMIKWSQMLCVKPDQGERGDWDTSEHQDSNLPVGKLL